MWLCLSLTFILESKNEVLLILSTAKLHTQEFDLDSINSMTSFMLLGVYCLITTKLEFHRVFWGTHELIYAENNLLSPYTYLTPVHVLGKVLL